MSVRAITAAAFAALTLGSAVATPNQAHAMSYGGIVAAGVVGGLALGAIAAEAAPRRGYVVEHRYVRRNGRLHYCGCVVRSAPVYPW